LVVLALLAERAALQVEVATLKAERDVLIDTVRVVAQDVGVVASVIRRKSAPSREDQLQIAMLEKWRKWLLDGLPRPVSTVSPDGPHGAEMICVHGHTKRTVGCVSCCLLHAKEPT
jgi:chorismate mutase